MKPPASATKETTLLISYLQNPSTTQESAIDALVEYIMARRRKGWSIYEVTLGLIEIMQKVSEECGQDELALADITVGIWSELG
jgi:hypothetical protein